MAQKGQKHKNRNVTKSCQEDGQRQEKVYLHSEELEQYNFERELNWCVAQLQRKMTALTNKRTAGRAEEVHKLIRTLTNKKVPTTKKRVLMRNSFGDYRKKMEEDERLHLDHIKKLRLQKVSNTEDVQPGKFYRHSYQRPPHGHKAGSDSSLLSKQSCDVKTAPEKDVSQHEKVNWINQKVAGLGFSDTGFKFNFDVEASLDVIESSTNEADISSSSLPNETKQKEETVTTPTFSPARPTRMRDFFKSATTDFQFNFNIDEGHSDIQ